MNGFSQEDGTYNIVSVHGRILDQESGKPLNVGEKVYLQTILQFGALSDRAILIAPSRGRYRLELTTPSSGLSVPSGKALREIKSRPQLLTSTRGIRLSTEGVSVGTLQDYFKTDTFTIIGEMLKIPVNKKDEQKYDLMFRYESSNGVQDVIFSGFTVHYEQINRLQIDECFVLLREGEVSMPVKQVKLYFLSEKVLFAEFAALLSALDMSGKDTPEGRRELKQYCLDVYGTIDEQQLNRSISRFFDGAVPEDMANNRPPEIMISDPVNGSIIGTQQAKVTFHVSDISGIQSVKVMVNGRTVQLLAPDDIRQGQNEITIDVPEQNSQVSLVAQNQYGSSTPATVQLNRMTDSDNQVFKPKLYVLAIGISNYKSPELRLNYSSKDATDFANTMLGQKGLLYSDVTIKKLTDKQATSVNIRDGLQWLRNETTARDIAILFLSGHGTNNNVGSFYYIPVNGDINRLAATCVSYTDIKEAVSSVAGKVIVFIDACHSGNILGNVQRKSAAIDQLVQELTSADNGAVVFTSSTGRQYSLESESWNNGAFTKALIEGIEGDADLLQRNSVTVKTLDAYVSGRVKELTKGEQAPTTIIPASIPDFPIAIVKEKKDRKNIDNQDEASEEGEKNFAGMIIPERVKMEDIDLVNLGDGQMFGYIKDSEKTPLDGKVRMIDGVNPEYWDAHFIEGYPEGKWDFYQKNKLKTTVGYKNGYYDGAYCDYHRSGGEVKIRGNYKNGKKDGVWEEFYESGIPERKSEYKDGELQKETSYFTDGKVSREAYYRNTRLHGTEKRYDFKDGGLISDLNYKNGKQVGRQMQQTGNVLKVSNYSEKGELDGSYAETYLDTKKTKVKGKYKDGKKEGIWEEFSSSGRKSRTEEYKNGDLRKSITYFNDGNIENEFHYLHHEQHGPEKRYSRSGVLITDYNYQNGRRVGRQMHYFSGFENDYIQVSHYSEVGELEGEYSETYVKGSHIREKGKYKAGEKDGTWQYGTPDGKIIREEIYSNGKLLEKRDL
ncbi:MAG: caspase family protein [Bacteroidales bacterium]|nr:caspase family protein [Bacteroidales bacterium]